MFECVDELLQYFKDEDGDNDYYRARIFIILKISKEEFNIEKKRHNLFRRYVGTHTDYIENKENNPHSYWLARLLKKWFNINVSKLYYNRKFEPISYDENEVLAWYTKHEDGFDFKQVLMKSLLA